MRLHLRFALILLACISAGPAFSADPVFTQVSYSGDDQAPEVGQDQFLNPVVAGFYPDPSVVRVGDDFYLVNSTFGYFPGLPVFHSRDLVSWVQIGNAIDRADQIDYGKGEVTAGLFAASISYHDGLFYIVNTCFYCDRGNFLVTAKDPAGPWSDPVWLGFTGIDPSLFFDDDGTAWILNNDIPQGKMRYDGHRAIWVQQFDPDTQRMIGPRRVLVDGGADPASKPEHIEGPHVFKRNGWYYLTAAEGGTGEQHAQMIWRSKQRLGPYQPWPGNPTLSQRDLDYHRARPITSTGHADFVELADGQWWAVFLATRPFRGNQYNLGRETFLLPVQWQDDWPMILPRGQRVPEVAARPDLPRNPQPLPTTGKIVWQENFQENKLPLQWLTIHPPQQPWFATGAEGLRITPSRTPLGVQGEGQPSFVAHRLQHHHATFETTLGPWHPEPGQLAGLAFYQNERYHTIVGVERDTEGTAIVLYRRAGKDDPAKGQRLKRIALADSAQAISFRYRLNAPTVDVDYSTRPGIWHALATGLDASLLTPDVAGGFIGNTFGPYALGQ